MELKEKFYILDDQSGCISLTLNQSHLEDLALKLGDYVELIGYLTINSHFRDYVVIVEGIKVVEDVTQELLYDLRLINNYKVCYLIKKKKKNIDIKKKSLPNYNNDNDKKFKFCDEFQKKKKFTLKNTPVVPKKKENFETFRLMESNIDKKNKGHIAELKDLALGNFENNINVNNIGNMGKNSTVNDEFDDDIFMDFLPDDFDESQIIQEQIMKELKMNKNGINKAELENKLRNLGETLFREIDSLLMLGRMYTKEDKFYIV
ncbi:hypothetical protein HK099_001827 [Clydaea vesicula]|uniref:Uncharacterized protein n=1 Tax=Clydaea vesicula TaxID=447962 RepID=A0AAD5TTK0_9FUNG|nr:hypothetical protein HK099_001827 [Clydaea vesicula]